MNNNPKKRRLKDITVDDVIDKKVNVHEIYSKEIRTKEYVILAAFILVVVSLVVVSNYTGFVAYHEGQGGKLYNIDLKFKQPTYNWAAIYGASFGVGVTQPWDFEIDPGSLTEANVFFECFENGIEHEVYASTVPFEELDMNSLNPATYSDINNFIGVDSSAYESAENTYTERMSAEYGSTQINNIPSTHTQVGEGTNITTFPTGILKDGNGNIILVAKVFDGLTKGFNNRYYNYQSLLPIPGNDTVTYHLFSDPNDVCIGGSDEPEILGYVQGNVTDESGNPIEAALIVVGSYSTPSDEEGFYNLTTQAGEQRIIAIKEGYQVYENNINITANNVTYHNIVMELDFVPNQFNNIGPDFNAGEDDPGDNVDVGPGEVPFRIENPQVIEGQDYIIPIAEIKKKLRVDEFSQDAISIYSFKKEPVQLNFELIGSVKNITAIDKNNLVIAAESDGSVLLTFFANQTPGIYNGTLNITGGIQAEIPITIEILPKDKIPIQALLLSLSASDKTLYSGSTLNFRTDMTNLLSDQQYPVEIFYSIQNLEGTETIWTYRTNVFLKTSLSLLKNVELPADLPIGEYVLRANARYMELTSSASHVFSVETPFYQSIVFGKIRIWHIALGVLLLAGILFGIWYLRKKLEEKKKYHLKVELSQMPQGGARDIKVGKIAESQHKAWFNLEKFKVHTIVAGSTGGGKSFSAQVIIEEMLLKDIAVIVFDPTAQWTGMLRKLKNKGLLNLYSSFGMKQDDAKAFKGNIRQIDNPRELIDIKKFMKPGEIQVFACHKLDPKDMDIFVANTVRQVFRQNFDESEPLRLVLVYDEVHRLLPKFGGSGEGFLQIERACREFRKWGIGVMLISQVLADFVGQIKANINTEVQMRTRDEGDLERIKTKYGTDVLQSLVKASVGTGMVENSAYNRGRPYFVTFRPIMHSVARLTDEEIEKYNEYNEKIDQMLYELDQLEELKEDVFDMKLEMKLAIDKVKAGNFNMAQIYLDEIGPRLEKLWKKLGKEPKKLEKQVVSEEELQAELEKAKAGRKEYEKENKKEEKSEENNKISPAEKFKKDVPPDKILKLHNDMLVVNPTSLYSEIQAMKDADFEYHVNENKNDFADWLKDVVGDEELGKLIEQESDKKTILELLDKRQKGEKLPKLEIKKKKPEETKDTEKSSKADNKDEGKQEEKKESENQEPEDNNIKNSEERNEEIKKEHDLEITDKDEDEETEEEKKKREEQQKALEELSKEPEKEENEDKNEETEKESDLEKETVHESEILEKKATPDKYFRLENGEELKSIKDLKEYLPKMADEMFKNHVQDNRNDFANWIRHVFNEEELAEQISNTKSKSGLEEVLSHA